MIRSYREESAPRALPAQCISMLWAEPVTVGGRMTGHLFLPQASRAPEQGCPHPVKHKSNLGHGNPWFLVPESSCVASGSWGRQEPGLFASPHPQVGPAHVPEAAAGTLWTTAAPGCEGEVSDG